MEKPLIDTIVNNWREARKIHGDWREEAMTAYRFYFGDQWNSDDKAKLEEQRRPAVTFNRVGPFIDAVQGSEINDRKEVRYLPRTIDDSGITELYTAAANWVRDECDAEDEESEAFKDDLITGMGWTETRVDFEEDPQGKICIERVPPLEMEWDPEARKEGLSDAAWVCREKWWRKQDILDRWPDAELFPETHELYSDQMSDHDASKAWQYKNDTNWYSERTGRFRVMHYQYRERETYYKVVDPVTGDVEEMKRDRFMVAKAHLDEQQVPYVPLTRWKYRQAFVVSKKIVEESDLPCKGFSYQAITGKREEETNTFYGMMRSMKDPQEWANKFFSQFMHIINSNAKGGLLAEEGAFVNPRKAEDMWARPDSVLLLNEGGLNKIKERDVNKLPSGVDRMLQFAISAIPDVSGINLELLGMVQREQAGILEQQRKQSALTILAPMFNSLRRYRKQQGRLLLEYINKFISDGRLIRIKGKDAEQYVPLRKMPDTVKFDVIVDQAPTSPNLKQETWMLLQNVLPAAMKAGIPIPPDLLDFTPLPQTLVTNWKKFIQDQSANRIPPELQKKMADMNQTIQKLGQENMQLKTRHDEKMMEAKADHHAKMTEIENERQAMQARLQLEREKMQAELQLAREKAEAELMLKRHVSNAELNIKERKTA